MSSTPPPQLYPPALFSSSSLSILHNIINQLICTFSSLKKRLELNLLCFALLSPLCPDLSLVNTFTFIRLPKLLLTTVTLRYIINNVIV